MKPSILLFVTILLAACGKDPPQSLSRQVLIEESSTIMDGYMIRNYKMELSDDSIRIMKANSFSLKSNVKENNKPVFFIGLTELSTTHYNEPMPALVKSSELELQTIESFDSIPSDAILVQITAHD